MNEINTPRRDGRYASHPVKAATRIPAGVLVAVDADGYAVPASDTEGLTVVGRAEGTVNNPGVSGAERVTVCRECVKYENSATNPITAAGKPAYVEDEGTVAADTEKKIPAGVVVELDADGGVWIDPATAPLL